MENGMFYATAISNENLLALIITNNMSLIENSSQISLQHEY
jgi:hypothetical protein